MCRGLCLPFFHSSRIYWGTFSSVQHSPTPVVPLGQDTQGRHGGSVMQLEVEAMTAGFSPRLHM